MYINKPLRVGVVEVRQRALLERLRGVLVTRDETPRIPEDRLVDPFDPFGRVKPSVAQIDQLSGLLGYSQGTRVGGVVTRRNVGR